MYIRYKSKMDNALSVCHSHVLRHGDRTKAILNRLGTTTMYLNLEILNFYYWCNVFFDYV